MIKDLHRILYTLSAIDRLWPHFSSIKDNFELKNEEELVKNYSNIDNMCSALSTENSTYTIRLMQTSPYFYTAFGFFDKDDELVSIFQSRSHIGQTHLYENWAMLDGYDDLVRVHDSKSQKTCEVISTQLGEDEHFQMMMERNMPDYEVLKKVLEYIEDTLPALHLHKLVNPISYDNLDLDFSAVEFRDDVLNTIQEQVQKHFSFLDTMKNEPNTSFREQYMSIYK